jgi:NAD(P)-dependent dehydrogenase (short-subunit alcohol dehydrogenase family)
MNESTEIAGRRVVITGSHPLALGVASWFADSGAGVAVMAEPGETIPPGITAIECDFRSSEAVQAAVEAAVSALGGVDQFVHAWIATGLVERAAFMDVDEGSWIGRCEHSLEGAWWLSQQAIGPLREGGGSVVYLVPNVGLTGAAGFSMLATVAEGIRVLAKGCGRQWGKHHVTANIVATEPGLWVGASIADELFRAISLSVPAFGDIADPHDDLGPLVSMLGGSEGHYLTAGTLVADGGVWMAL